MCLLRPEIESICIVGTSEEQEDFFAKQGLLNGVLSDEALHSIIRPTVKDQGRPMF